MSSTASSEVTTPEILPDDHEKRSPVFPLIKLKTELPRQEEAGAGRCGAHIEVIVIHNTSSEGEAENAPENSTSRLENRINRVGQLNRRRTRWNFSLREERKMVKYLIENKQIAAAKGNNVWRKMLEDGHLTHRTYQSLNNHFRKHILHNLHKFRMEAKHARKFRKLLRK